MASLPRPAAVPPGETPAPTRLSLASRARGVVTGALGVLDPAVLAGARRRGGVAGGARHDLAARAGRAAAGAAATRPTASSTCPPCSAGLLVSDVEAAGTPILLVHGIVSNRSIFTLLRRGPDPARLLQRLRDELPTVATDVRAAAARLSVEVERIVEETGFERIHIIGHSLGGLIARYYVTRLGGDARVHTLVTLGTPHEGSVRRVCRADPLMQQMRPGQRPDARARPAGAGLPHAVHRLLVRQRPGDPPPAHAALRHRDLGARNVRLHGAGHLTLPMLRRGRARHLQRPGPPRRARAGRSRPASRPSRATSERCRAPPATLPAREPRHACELHHGMGSTARQVRVASVPEGPGRQILRSNLLSRNGHGTVVPAPSLHP